MSTWLQALLSAAVGAETQFLPLLVKHPTLEKIIGVVLVAEESAGAVLGINLNPGNPAVPGPVVTPPIAPGPHA